MRGFSSLFWVLDYTSLRWLPSASILRISRSRRGKSQAVRDLYGLLVDELNKLGPVQEIKKAISISFENRRPFASVLIRDRSIKLVLRTRYRITNARILGIVRVADKSFDHTILLDSKKDIDDELMEWLGEAYQSAK
jgi:hypothetical protein